MKPAPLSDLTYTDPQTHIKVISNQALNKTHAIDLKGREIWSMSSSLGRQKVSLSFDGETLILLGSHAFGSRIRTDPNAYILNVYHLGQLENQLTFKQVFGFTIEETMINHQVPEIGGGWISMNTFVTIDHIDWDSRSLHFTFKDEVKGYAEF